MALVLKSLVDGGPDRRIDPGRSFSIGRGTDNDLVIVDPNREVSKTHCRIESEGDTFVLVDISINGVTIEGEATPMGPGVRHTLATGDVFVVGRQRFGVEHDDGVRTAATVAAARAASPGVGQILEGGSEGPEARASGGVTGDAERWLGTLPTGMADETLHVPMGWDEPPSTQASVLPLDPELIASDFANRSEHVAAHSNAIHLPRAEQVIPNDWLDEEAGAARNQPSISVFRHQSSAPAATPFAGPTSRQAFADGGRVDPAGLAGLTDEQLLRRCGEALRALLEGLDTIEAAQAVAEHDCGLPTSPNPNLWTDFFATNRDPLLALLGENEPARVLTQRIADLANRQRALGHAVADAARRYDAALAPETIEAETRSRLRPGPLAKAAAWTRFAGLHADLKAAADGEGIPSFLVLMRKSFARAMTRRP